MSPYKKLRKNDAKVYQNLKEKDLLYMTFLQSQLYVSIFAQTQVSSTK